MYIHCHKLELDFSPSFSKTNMITLYNVTIRDTERVGLYVTRPSAPFGPLSSLATHFIWHVTIIFERRGKVIITLIMCHIKLHVGTQNYKMESYWSSLIIKHGDNYSMWKVINLWLARPMYSLVWTRLCDDYETKLRLALLASCNVCACVRACVCAWVSE